MADPIGRLLKLWSNPCSPTPEIWVETASPAALKALISLIPIDWKHTVHHLTGKSWVKNLSGIMAEAEFVEPEIVALGRRFLIRTAVVLDVIAWYLFLADVGLDFLANWTSMAYKMSGCIHDSKHEHFYADRPFGSWEADGNWWPCGAWHEIYPSPGSITSPSLMIPPGATGGMGCAFKPSPIFGGPVPYSTRIRDAESGRILDQFDVGDPSPLLGNGAIVMEPKFKSGKTGASLIFEVMSPPINDGHPHVIGFDGGSFSAYWTLDD